MDKYRLAKLMRIEKECVMRAKKCNRKCADCDLVQEDKDLISAYDAVIGLIEDPRQRQVVFCCQCVYWDKESGLTARKCTKHGRITVQYGYCSDGKEVRV